MRSIFIFIIACAFSLNVSGQQGTGGQKLYDAMFKWSIVLPDGFENISPEEYAGIQKKGTDAIENTYDQKIINQSKPIFAFRSDKMHYFESNFQPFDEKTDGSHAQNIKTIGDVLYNTFSKQLAGVKMDTIYTKEVVDELKFDVFKLDMYLPNNNILTAYMYNRLFGKSDFSVVIMFVDREKGKAMLNSFRASKFAKN